MFYEPFRCDKCGGKLRIRKFTSSLVSPSWLVVMTGLVVGVALLGQCLDRAGWEKFFARHPAADYAAGGALVALVILMVPLNYCLLWFDTVEVDKASP